MLDAPARILAVTDLSQAGDVALVDAHRRAQALGATLGIVHAIPTLEAIRPLFPQQLASELVLGAELPVRAEEMLRERLEDLGVTGDFELFVEQGSTADVALDVIKRWQPGLIVIGSPADGVVGSVGIVRHASSPVLIARTSPSTKRVVVGTDFSRPSLPAITLAARTAEAMAGELVVVHAIEQNPIMIYGLVLPTVTAAGTMGRQEAAEQHMRDAIDQLGVTATTRIVNGAPAKALIDVAAELEAEVLVVGTHGRTGLTRFLMGSIAEAVIHQAPCSVLIARIG